MPDATALMQLYIKSKMEAHLSFFFFKILGLLDLRINLTKPRVLDKNYFSGGTLSKCMKCWNCHNKTDGCYLLPQNKLEICDTKLQRKFKNSCMYPSKTFMLFFPLVRFNSTDFQLIM